MNRLPGFLTHYYKGDRPLRSLSLLSGSELDTVVAGLREENTLAYGRFRSDDYLSERRRVEEHLRERFRAKGGAPELEFPLYFVVGRSSWFERHEPVIGRCTVPIDELDSKKVSFTYGDSMISLAIAEGRWRHGSISPRSHDGEVYRLEELADLIDEHGSPEERHQAGGDQRFDYYLEAQVWDPTVVDRVAVTPPTLRERE